MIWTFDLPVEATRPWANSRRDYGRRMYRHLAYPQLSWSL